MYLSYSGFKKYEQCPRSYWHGYINKTKLPTPDNRVGMLYGSVVGTLFEYFYKDRLWHAPDPVEALLSRVPRVMKRTIEWESKSGTWDWKQSKVYKSFADVEADVRKTIPRGLAIIRHHRLVGVDAEPEVRLDSDFDGHTLGGRCDFIIQRLHPQGDLVLIDGKGSRWRDKYVDRRQLKWYGMLFQKKHGSLPDRFGFLYWQFEPDESLDWVDCTVRDVEMLNEAVMEAVRSIEAGGRRLSAEDSDPKKRLFEAFPTRPTRECKLCPFLSLCDEGTAYTKSNSPSFEAVSGVEDLGL